MYFKDKSETNIDKDFREKRNKLTNNNLLGNFKKINPIMIIVAVFAIAIGIVLLTSNKTKYYILLWGKNPIVIYKDSEYIEPGFIAKDNKDRNLENQVVINSNLNTNVIGEYQIVYKLKKISLTRTVKVAEKPIGHTVLHLKGDSVIYLKKNEQYQEPGYIAIDTNDSTLTSKVEVTSNLNNNKAGSYQIVYSVTNSSGLTVQNKRNIIVLDDNISLILDNQNYTNGQVNILVNVYYNKFSSLTLPNGSVVNETKYTYPVSENGEYKFIIKNSLGEKQEAIIKVNNIDKINPTGNCSATHISNTTKIEINANDNTGISRYIVDGNSYNSSSIILNKKLDKVNVLIYDMVNNQTVVTCTIKEAPKQEPPKSEPSKSNTTTKKPVSGYSSVGAIDNKLNIPYYSQCDTRWKNIYYAGQNTFCSSSCGYTSLAMIVAGLARNTTVTPITIVEEIRNIDLSRGQKATKRGPATRNELTNNNYLSKYGIKARNLPNISNGGQSSKEKQEILNALNNQEAIIIEVPGHYMVLAPGKNGYVVLLDSFSGRWKDRRKKSGEYQLELIYQYYGDVKWAAAYSRK